MSPETVVELEQIYQWLLFIKDNILPIVLSGLAAIITAIGGTSAMLSKVRRKVTDQAVVTEKFNESTKGLISKFTNEFTVVDNRIKTLLDKWDTMEGEFKKVKDLHDQLEKIKASVQMIATEDAQLVKEGISAEVVKVLGE
jgi:uncharacterized membrane protein